MDHGIDPLKCVSASEVVLLCRKDDALGRATHSPYVCIRYLQFVWASIEIITAKCTTTAPTAFSRIAWPFSPLFVDASAKRRQTAAKAGSQNPRQTTACTAGSSQRSRKISLPSRKLKRLSKVSISFRRLVEPHHHKCPISASIWDRPSSPSVGVYVYARQLGCL